MNAQNQEPSDRFSESGRQWVWCRVWKCWQHDNYKFKIYPQPDGFTCSYDSVWLDGMFKSFEDAEKELFN